MLDKVKVGLFINAAMKYKGNLYSQKLRMEKGYSDCSSLIQKALTDINLNTRKKVTVTTHRMGIEGDSRFRQIPKSQIQRGDILWGGGYVNGRWEGHVAIYLGDGKTLEARVREGVDYNKDRAYFTRAYRIVALEKSVSAPKPDPTPKPNVIENVPILIEGKQMPTKGYIVEGVTYIDVKGIAYPVRNFFESLGCEVKWIDNKVVVTI